VLAEKRVKGSAKTNSHVSDACPSNALLFLPLLYHFTVHYHGNNFAKQCKNVKLYFEVR